MVPDPSTLAANVAAAAPNIIDSVAVDDYHSTEASSSSSSTTGSGGSSTGEDWESGKSTRGTADVDALSNIATTPDAVHSPIPPKRRPKKRPPAILVKPFHPPTVTTARLVTSTSQPVDRQPSPTRPAPPQPPPRIRRHKVINYITSPRMQAIAHGALELAPLSRLPAFAESRINWMLSLQVDPEIRLSLVKHTKISITADGLAMHRSTSALHQALDLSLSQAAQLDNLDRTRSRTPDSVGLDSNTATSTDADMDEYVNLELAGAIARIHFVKNPTRARCLRSRSFSRRAHNAGGHRTTRDESKAASMSPPTTRRAAPERALVSSHNRRIGLSKSTDGIVDRRRYMTYDRQRRHPLSLRSATSEPINLFERNPVLELTAQAVNWALVQYTYDKEDMTELGGSGLGLDMLSRQVGDLDLASDRVGDDALAHGKAPIADTDNFSDVDDDEQIRAELMAAGGCDDSREPSVEPNDRVQRPGLTMAAGFVSAPSPTSKVTAAASSPTAEGMAATPLPKTDVASAVTLPPTEVAASVPVPPAEVAAEAPSPTAEEEAAATSVKRNLSRWILLSLRRRHFRQTKIGFRKSKLKSKIISIDDETERKPKSPEPPGLSCKPSNELSSAMRSRTASEADGRRTDSRTSVRPEMGNTEGPNRSQTDSRAPSQTRSTRTQSRQSGVGAESRSSSGHTRSHGTLSRQNSRQSCLAIAASLATSSGISRAGSVTSCTRRVANFASSRAGSRRSSNLSFSCYSSSERPSIVDKELAKSLPDNTKRSKVFFRRLHSELDAAVRWALGGQSACTPLADCGVSGAEEMATGVGKPIACPPGEKVPGGTASKKTEKKKTIKIHQKGSTNEESKINQRKTDA